MNLTCLMIATNLESQLSIFERSIASVNKFIFKRKILTIDVFNNGFDLSYFDKYPDWDIISGKTTGLINNMLRGLDQIDSGLIFYCEDHNLVTAIPKDIGTLSWVCYNTHIVPNCKKARAKLPKKKYEYGLAYINDKHNYIKYGQDIFLIKNASLKDEYYLNTPVIITDVKILKALLTYGIKHYKNIPQETGLTNAWFDLGYDKQYNVGIYVKDIKFPLSFDMLNQCANIRCRYNDTTMEHVGVVDYSKKPKGKNCFF